MYELIPSGDKDTTCFTNFQGGPLQAYAMTADNTKFWLATASNSGYTFLSCKDSPSVLDSLCRDGQSFTCSSPASPYYTPTNILPSPTVGERKSLSISGEGTFVLGLPDSNKVYISTSLNLQAKELPKSNADPQQQFGRCVDITATGDIIAVGAPMMNNVATTNTGGVYMFKKDSSVTTNKWEQIALLSPPNSVKVNQFGKKVGFSDDDTLLAIVSNEMILVYERTDSTATGVPQYKTLLFNSGPWTEFGSIDTGGITNFDGGVSIISDESESSPYIVYGKDNDSNTVALEVSVYEIVKSHPISQSNLF